MATKDVAENALGEILEGGQLKEIRVIDTNDNSKVISKENLAKVLEELFENKYHIQFFRKWEGNDADLARFRSIRICAGDVSHVPSNGFGTLIALSDTDQIVQLYVVAQKGLNQLWLRQRSVGEWTSWVKII